jgi:pimeloyl-ACP methyl ester carboxylesterase
MMASRRRATRLTSRDERAHRPDCASPVHIDDVPRWCEMEREKNAVGHALHVAVGDLRVGYRRRGAGPVLLLLHGAVCDSRVWRVEVDSFADAFTVVAWDAPGCGASDDPPGSFRMREFADCLIGFVEALQLGSLHVLGHSWGAALALEMCRRRPDLVRTLVLVGAYAGWAGSLPPNEVRQRLQFALTAADATADFDPMSMPGLFSDAMPGDRARELTGLMAQIRPVGTRTMAYALAEADLREALPAIEVPTLLVHGSADARSSTDVARAIQRSIPGSTMSVLPGLGHECFLESPSMFDAAVRPFLRAHS